MTRHSQCPTTRLSLCGIVLASVWLMHFSSATATSWGAPLRIGIQASLSHHQPSKKRFHSFLAKAQSTQEALAIDERDQEQDSFKEEWNSLFQNEEDRNGINGITYAARQSRAIKPRNDFEANQGFRQTLRLPAFLARENDDPKKYEEEIVPCAISVSTKAKGQQVSFSSSMPSRQSTTSRSPTLNQRKKNATGKSQGSASKKLGKGRPLVFWENMVCGAISRSVAQTVMHPANTMKTLLQQSNPQPLVSYLRPSELPLLFRGAGANFVLSVPHGALNFAVLETVRIELSKIVAKTKYSEEKIGPALDFMSSAISTVCCSVLSTPQMMITDNIMAGNYKNLGEAVRGLAAEGKGLGGFYARGWWPGLVGKIPSYAMTWTFFQQLKVAQLKMSGRPATNVENSIMGCVASGTTVCIMIPMDTIKTRLVTQATAAGVVPYKGIVDCAVRILREEGVKSFYLGLPPRLVSVVPLIGIQFSVYEAMKRVMQKRKLAEQRVQQQPKPVLPIRRKNGKGKAGDGFDPYSSLEQLQESCMEVAASPEHPYPAPHFLRRMRNKNRKQKR